MFFFIDKFLIDYRGRVLFHRNIVKLKVINKVFCQIIIKKSIPYLNILIESLTTKFDH